MADQKIIDQAERVLYKTYNRYPVVFDHGKGVTLYDSEGNAYLEGGRIEQGFTEAANVEVVPEMVNMIEVQRQFEAYQKVMQTSDTLDRAATEKVGRRQG